MPQHHDDGTATFAANGRSSSLAEDADSCTYSFDPSRETDARLRTTWECPHEAHEDAAVCIFHMNADQRQAHGVTDEDLVEQFLANIGTDSQRANEYVGADLPHLSLTYKDVDGVTNNVLNFQYADLDGIDLTHGTFDQGLNLSEATVGRLKLDSATFQSVVEAEHVTVEGPVSAHEATFEEDVRFPGATFRDAVTCDEATFGADTDFSGVTFQDVANFRAIEARGTSHELEDHITFEDAVFRDGANFQQSTLGYSMFRGAAFRDRSDFAQVAFGGNTNFAGATFDRVAEFDDAAFTDDATFEGATFEQRATFAGCRFAGGSRATHDDVSFEDARFGGDVEFRLAQFRFVNFEDATVVGTLDCDRAVVDARADWQDLTVRGDAKLSSLTCDGPVTLDGATVEGDVDARRAEFGGDASFVAASFEGEVVFDEARFREDADFAECTVGGTAAFRGATFEGAANHVEANASFREATFQDAVTFESATFVTVSFWDTELHADCTFADAAFSESARFRVETGETTSTYVDLTDAHVAGGVISEGGDMVPYDLTRATLGAVRLEGKSNRYELLDYFRFCLTEFDRFDFTNHNAYLERNDWNIHTFVGDDAVQSAVEMDNEVIEETYRRAQEAADAIGANDAKRGFEFRRWYYNRQKNWDLVLNEYSLNGFTRLKKLASIVLNVFFQYTCGYANRVPRIFISMGVFTLAYAVLFTLGGPFETQAGVIFDSDAPGRVLFDAVYYSGISFTTIGYGDIGPIGWAAKLLAASEGYLSAIMFTLLTVTLLRSAIGSS